MKNPSYVAAWVDAVNVHIRFSDPPNPTMATTWPAVDGRAPSTPERSADDAATRVVTQGLAQLGHLSPGETVVIFTPVLIPLASSDFTLPPATDPFEVLGRKLSQYHQRIRHVPYVPHVGFTDTHAALLEHAGAVVAVTCQPTGRHAIESLAGQARFAKMATKAHAGSIPPSWIHFGDEESRDGLVAGENVHWGEQYGPEAIQRVTELLFQ